MFGKKKELNSIEYELLSKKIITLTAQVEENTTITQQLQTGFRSLRSKVNDMIANDYEESEPEVHKKEEEPINPSQWWKI